jgi:large subunit ribosomal protein L6
MSRIGRLPIAVPSGVQVKIDGHKISVKGQRGELVREFHPDMEIKLEDGKVVVGRPSDSPTHRALHGTTRALLNNMVTGVSQGFRKVLQIEGVGYRATQEGANLVFYLGFSHPIKIEQPAGIKFVADEKAKTVTIEGNDREQVGQVAANLRKLRPPEPYKGKGVMYQGERIRHKAGKAGKVA